MAGRGHSGFRGAASRGNSASQRGGAGFNGRPASQKFERYWSESEVQKGLISRYIIEGPLRINQRNSSEAYVSHPDGGTDVFIENFIMRNRALNGDIVCVQLHPQGKWLMLKSSLDELEQEINRESLASLNSKFGKISVSPSDASRRHWSIDELLQSNEYPGVKRLLRSSSADDQSKINSKLSRTGKVVYIKEKKHSRICCGRFEDGIDCNKQSFKFKPCDKRLPKMLISVHDCDPELVRSPAEFQNKLFLAKINEWHENHMMANGEILECLGEAGEIEPETKRILVEQDVDFGDFSQKVQACLPSLSWSIPDSEFSYRRDLRHQCIFTIDFSTTRDLDDSLSCEELPNGLLEVGVHIADVSYFVRPTTALDEEAFKRTTTVYLGGGKNVPMLPLRLSEELCSLNPHQDRLAFSIIWKMKSTGEIVEEWFGRTVIRSCVRLEYKHTQGFIKEPLRDWKSEELPSIEGFNISDVKERVIKLHKLAETLQEIRVRNGALFLRKVELYFNRDQTTGLPIGYSVGQKTESKSLVEEFMVLANLAVALKIYDSKPDFALLNRQPPPLPSQLENLKKKCKGIELDTSSSGALQRSVTDFIKRPDLNPDSTSKLSSDEKYTLLSFLCSKSLQASKYFCSGSLPDKKDYYNYSFSAELYTNFTSPIRRYTDLMVHRLLAASLGYCDWPKLDVSSMQKLCEHCNSKGTAARKAQNKSNELSLYTVIQNRGGVLFERGVVTHVMNRSFEVLILNVGEERRVHLNTLSPQIFEYDDTESVLTLLWESDTKHSPPRPQVKQKITVLMPVNCRLIPGKQPPEWTVELLHPLDSIPHGFE